MISLQDIEINEITLGDTPIVSIEFGSIPVWPSGYYYELVFKNVTYSSNTQLLTSGINFATFTCYYRKYRSSNNTLVSTEEVIATPSSSYCFNEGTKLYFDYDNYKATTLSSDSNQQVSLQYNGVTATGYVSRQGNSSWSSSSISAIVLSSTVADASGGNITYTGGDVTTTTNWTSGYTEAGSTTAADFPSSGATNSQSTNTVGHIIAYTKTVYIPSLANNITSGQSSYTFTSNSYNGQTVSVTVYQAQNARYQQSSYSFWNPDPTPNVVYSTVNLPAVPGASSTFRFVVKQTTHTWYDSGYDTTTGGTNINNSNYNVTKYDVLNGGCVTAVNPLGSEMYEGYYGPNTTGSKKQSIIVAVSTNNDWNATLSVVQAAS